eukprot:CAMPEP_0173424720 /NCGR_PEP_ID=MMETSP1357-20121228/4592_1 /TAXON_ID=77926 /ORGANISM="Hemiselmis rufescens, Strain PCC563" /LENGTH=83 /DNA_ID=CAMNT_0014388009 /DNA_START=36 /DNA_END=285 /DNA_ORIENTATION=+
MFALLAQLQVNSRGDLFRGLMSSQGGEMLLAQPSADQIAAEQKKASEGYCETYLWNCQNLYGPGDWARSEHGALSGACTGYFL